MHQFHMHFSCMGDDSFLLVPNNKSWKKKTSVHIAHELIILEREHLKRAGSSASSVLAARALLARNGFTVNDAATDSSAAPCP